MSDMLRSPRSCCRMYGAMTPNEATGASSSTEVNAKTARIRFPEFAIMNAVKEALSQPRYDCEGLV